MGYVVVDIPYALIPQLLLYNMTAVSYVGYDGTTYRVPIDQCTVEHVDSFPRRVATDDISFIRLWLKHHRFSEENPQAAPLVNLDYVPIAYNDPRLFTALRRQSFNINDYVRNQQRWNDIPVIQTDEDEERLVKGVL